MTRDLVYGVPNQPVLLFWSNKFVVEWNFFTSTPPRPLFLRAPVKSAGNTLLALKSQSSSLIVPNLFLKKSKNQILPPLLQHISNAHHGMMTCDTRSTRVASPLRVRLVRIASWDCMVKQKPLPKRNLVKILNFFSCFNTKWKYILRRIDNSSLFLNFDEVMWKPRIRCNTKPVPNVTPECLISFKTSLWSK